MVLWNYTEFSKEELFGIFHNFFKSVLTVRMQSKKRSQVKTLQSTCEKMPRSQDKGLGTSGFFKTWNRSSIVLSCPSLV